MDMCAPFRTHTLPLAFSQHRRFLCFWRLLGVATLVLRLFLDGYTVNTFCETGVKTIPKPLSLLFCVAFPKLVFLTLIVILSLCVIGR